MHSQQAVTREDIEIKILEMVMNAERRAFFAGTLKYNVNSRRSYIRELQSCTDIENLKKWFLDKTREICTKLENSKEKEAGSIIDRAKEYINENFRRDISLDDVSREVDISPYYFSKLFKQETGKNFIEYLTEIRLKMPENFCRIPDFPLRKYVHSQDTVIPITSAGFSRSMKELRLVSSERG